MRRVALGVLCLVISILFLPTVNAQAQNVTETIQLNYQDSLLSESINKFTFDLFKIVIDSNADENVFISPFSVSYALGMVYNGALGETRDAMRDVLQYDSLDDPGVNNGYYDLMHTVGQSDNDITLEIANSIWYADTLVLRSGFEFKNKTYFNSDILPIDFGRERVDQLVNQWADEKTHGRIKEILKGPLAPRIVMVLANAVYFKANWQYKFDEKLTEKQTFNLKYGREIECDMMHREGDFSFLVNNEVEAISLPYGNGDIQMTLLMPPGDMNIDDFVYDLSFDKWEYWRSKFHVAPVRLYMPKFKLDWNTELQDILKDLGMRIAFSGHADFGGIFEYGGVCINKVLHNTFVQVDEESTEAAAVTVITMLSGSAGYDTHNNIWVYRADEPFVFVIHDTMTGAILFIGKIEKPVWIDS